MNPHPAYEEHANKPRPRINRDTPSGNCFVIWQMMD
jgi:hypothetical protein